MASTRTSSIACTNHSTRSAGVTETTTTKVHCAAFYRTRSLISTSTSSASSCRDRDRITTGILPPPFTAYTPTYNPPSLSPRTTPTPTRTLRTSTNRRLDSRLRLRLQYGPGTTPNPSLRMGGKIQYRDRGDGGVG
ncbi:hypothetical protein SAICODRAFT_32086 [Saitoella complicata NRRL Y-17804]|uniref:uncharacterized protein n=1 Tax=Saitoella complicata (strain BCRC 22490 / CBS 7301 / JCM 7358 / NBRC 10748 / NRRL Y-17804) TaxID=698492 RepID=UPI000867A98B|nr:uncharacterized protein SAICODRAFT_32086 [Saitoella complicata NRRL Y-17804]ODQ50110.1 hypothetical protein SAICODRAFT_32086 [Saitoella complicata NRRL Y-17804]